MREHFLSKEADTSPKASVSNGMSDSCKKAILCVVLVLLSPIGGILIFPDFMSWNKHMFYSIYQAVVVTAGTVWGVFLSLEANPGSKKWKYICGFCSLFVFSVALTAVESIRFSPKVPSVSIETVLGLPTSFGRNPSLRLHRLKVVNNSDALIEGFCSRIQLPEPITEVTQTNASIGTAFDWHPLRVGLRAEGEAGRTNGAIWIGPTSFVHFVYPEPRFRLRGPHRGQQFMISGDSELTGIWDLSIDRLPPRGFVEIEFLTSNTGKAENYLNFTKAPFTEPNAPAKVWEKTDLLFYFEGEYDQSIGDESQPRYFFIPFTFDQTGRSLSMLPMQPDVGNWKPVFLEFY